MTFLFGNWTWITCQGFFNNFSWRIIQEMDNFLWSWLKYHYRYLSCTLYIDIYDIFIMYVNIYKYIYYIYIIFVMVKSCFQFRSSLHIDTFTYFFSSFFKIYTKTGDEGKQFFWLKYAVRCCWSNVHSKLSVFSFCFLKNVFTVLYTRGTELG